MFSALPGDVVALIGKALDPPSQLALAYTSRLCYRALTPFPWCRLLATRHGLALEQPMKGLVLPTGGWEEIADKVVAAQEKSKKSSPFLYFVTDRDLRVYADPSISTPLRRKDVLLLPFPAETFPFDLLFPLLSDHEPCVLVSLEIEIYYNFPECDVNCCVLTCAGDFVYSGLACDANHQQFSSLKVGQSAQIKQPYAPEKWTDMLRYLSEMVRSGCELARPARHEEMLASVPAYSGWSSYDEDSGSEAE